MEHFITAMRVICMSHWKRKIFIAILVYLRVWIPIPPGKDRWLAIPITLGLLWLRKRSHLFLGSGVAPSILSPHPKQLASWGSVAAWVQLGYGKKRHGVWSWFQNGILHYTPKNNGFSKANVFQWDMVVFPGGVPFWVEITWGNETYLGPRMQYFAATRSIFSFFR